MQIQSTRPWNQSQGTKKYCDQMKLQSPGPKFTLLKPFTRRPEKVNYAVRNVAAGVTESSELSVPGKLCNWPLGKEGHVF